MDEVADDFQEKQIEPRRRKLAVAHQNNIILIDANGNSKPLQRLNSVSETTPDVSSQWIDEEPNEVQDRSSVVWENSVLQQIQSLIKNVQVSESLAEYINKEILNEDDVNANIGPKSRRKSCFTLSNDIHSNTSRRQSVASICQNKSKSLPRTNLNDEMFNHFKQVNQRRRSSVAHPNGRRVSNAGQNQSRRSSVVQYSGGRRRSSVWNPVVQNQGPSCRRSSVTQINRRRSSLAHAYQHGAVPTFRRMSSVNDNELPVPINAISQRRRSSVKPPCFPVTKISSVQKRLHRIYNKRRRRQDRAEVKMSDVRKAFKGLKNEEYSGGSGSEDNTINDNDNLTSSTENEVSDENRDMCDEEIISPKQVTGSEAELNNTGTTEDINDNIAHSDEPKPNPRRKTSIQVRSWELSRRLRQRRREKRKGFTESDLI
ncbi:uncharacterized protein LOC132717600 [Ruditapes philippinarum]|uniref:uncharacterized protein LOC132717600 n=1 Tax=Ruditapes philippinarum TaxID=129788 RepID=UPI00295BDAB8|nr:uncharacterized protein LOC132717600 [Ruditapes philippinarum]